MPAQLTTRMRSLRYEQRSGLGTQEAFAASVERGQDAVLYDTGVTAGYGGELLTLATCSYHTKNGRFVVVACFPAGVA